ncbi:hypothetical protein JE024_40515 (plasmid) [Streptomyces zhihengii]|uniref:Uncharacterized protein n=1 Tax=Streptomyces zhihengii TaxID=1818004 RepID=A0ABS2V4V9_9ACTN|nr:hypothetical protein [Streptomyces zhihengii]
MALVLLTVAVVVIVALLCAVGAGVLARADGATWPTALARAASAFVAVLALSATVTAALAACLR